MAYSTGSGAYTDMMAAVLAHALADGWTEAGGVSTGWPIISPSGRIRGINWTTYTASEPDFTLGGDGLAKTQRFMRLGIGATPAGATANAATGPVCPNFAYTITQWWIFSDISYGEFIHVVFNFSNGVNSDCYSHFSFGEVDKGGMTYGSVGYVTTTDQRGYAQSTSGGVSSTDNQVGGNWNTINRTGMPFAGNYGEDDDGWASLTHMIHSTDAPAPNGSGGWQAWDTAINGGNGVWARPMRSNDFAYPSLDSDRDAGFINAAWWPAVQAATGVVPLIPIPFILMNGTGAAARNRWIGVFPNVRLCTMQNVSPEDEITYGGDTWKVFPMLRATPWNQLNVQYRVTTGYAGFAYKKVT